MESTKERAQRLAAEAEKRVAEYYGITIKTNVRLISTSDDRRLVTEGCGIVGQSYWISFIPWKGEDGVIHAPSEFSEYIQGYITDVVKVSNTLVLGIVNP